MCPDQRFIGTSSPEPVVDAASIRQIGVPKNTPDNLQTNTKFRSIIWEIILRDFWGNNLRVYVAELGDKDQIVAALRTKNAANNYV